MKQWLDPSRHLLVLLLAVILAPAVVLGWLAWRTLEQDRVLDRQRTRERQENAADLAALALARMIRDLETGREREGVLAAAFTPEDLAEHSGVPLLYVPAPPAYSELDPALFAAGEALEFRARDFNGAIIHFRQLASSTDAAVRAGALLRLGRVLRKAGNTTEALAVYEELGGMANTAVDGLPAALVARQAKASIHEAQRSQQLLREEAQALLKDLQEGRWKLTRASYRFAAEEARQQLGIPGPSESEQDLLAMASGVERVWQLWQASRATQRQLSHWTNGRAVLVLWRGSESRLDVVVAGPRALASRLGQALEGLSRSQRVRITITDGEGNRVHGTPVAPGATSRTAEATRLPWTIQALDDGSTSPALSAQARLMAWGLASLGLLLAAGAWLLARVMSRELAVARLKSDFVATVSHEFRTPLTSMIQLAELLVRGRVTRPERRQEFYETLLRESRRLHRLVESVLDFGRMESGRFQYRFEPLDPVALVRDLSAEFGRQAGDGCHVEFHAEETPFRVHGDRESLHRVFWNLLDNAVKYSPEEHTVWVGVQSQGDRVAVSVRDRGLGIPAAEQQQIFTKFVRGEAARTSNVRGTGLGLAMARQIVLAHSGDIHVESAPGEGSTFTVLLPVVE